MGAAMLVGTAVQYDAQKSAQNQAARIQEENEKLAQAQLKQQEDALKLQEQQAAEAIAAQRSAAAAQASAVRASAEAAAQQARESSRAASMQKATQVNLDAQRATMLERARAAEQDKSTKVAEVDVVADEAPAQRRRKQFSSSSNAPSTSLRI